jgi:hypothetical protein
MLHRACALRGHRQRAEARQEKRLLLLLTLGQVCLLLALASWLRALLREVSKIVTIIALYLRHVSLAGAIVAVLWLGLPLLAAMAAAARALTLLLLPSPGLPLLLREKQGAVCTLRRRVAPTSLRGTQSPNEFLNREGVQIE